MNRPTGFITNVPGFILSLSPRTIIYGNPDQPFHAWKTYGAWNYPMGVALTGIQRCSDVLGEKSFEQYVRDHFGFITKYFDHYRWGSSLVSYDTPVFPLVRLASLDDCGAMGASMSEAYLRKPEESYMAIIERVGNYIHNIQKRTSDGAFCRRKGSRGGLGHGHIRVWVDDMYHSSSCLVKIGRIKDDGGYFDDAVKQVKLYTERLFNPKKGLYSHVYYETEGERSKAHWGRADGWAFIAAVEVLSNLPADHPERNTILSIYKAHALGLINHQSECGFWHQLIDKPDSFLETSCTSMFVCGLARGVREGWLSGKDMEDARNAVYKGWNAVSKYHIGENGRIEGVSKGTDIRKTLDYYYKRPVVTNDLHGVGPVLMAAAEIMKLV